MLSHRALFYASPADLAATAAPLVQAGLERGDVVFAATKRTSMEALEDVLGGDPERAELRDTDEWCPRPWERLASIRRMVDALTDGAGLYVLGEPLWSGSDAAVREWARFESIVNVALAEAPIVFVCLYDERELPDEVLEHGRRTHPELLVEGSPSRCEQFVSPSEFVRTLVGPPDPTPVESMRELDLNGDQHAFRAAVRRAAMGERLGHERIEHLVVAVNEVATNALVHGRPPLRARCWSAGRDYVFEMADSGPGVTDPLAGWLPPKWPSEGGWGLSIARQLCDAVEIVPEGEGTRVRLHMEVEADTRPGRSA